MQNDVQERILAKLELIDGRMSEMDRRLQSVEPPTTEAESLVSNSESERGSTTSEAGAARTQGAESATPDSLRKNLRIMMQAAGRLAQIEGEEADDEDNQYLPRTKGKKSGSLRKATDSVKYTIDWPHMHVRRMTNGKRRTLAFTELTVEEFVYGFLTMLANTECKMDKDTMIELLRILMQDAMDYSWANAMNFYDTIAQEVEAGTLKWDDSVTIEKYRMQYSRAVFPMIKEGKEGKEAKETTRPQPKQAPPGMQCCAPFQKRECEQVRDHAPYTHACTYCFKSCSLLCRHAENDCIRKLADQSKNSKKREA